MLRNVQEIGRKKEEMLKNVGEIGKKGGYAERCVKRKYGKTELEFYWSSFGRYLQKRVVLKQRLIFSGHVHHSLAVARYFPS